MLHFHNFTDGNIADNTLSSILLSFESTRSKSWIRSRPSLRREVIDISRILDDPLEERCGDAVKIVLELVLVRYTAGGCRCLEHFGIIRPNQ